MIYVRANPKVAVGHWPIPESFWPDPGAQMMVRENSTVKSSFETICKDLQTICELF